MDEEVTSVETEIVGEKINDMPLREQLLEQGYCRFPGVLSEEWLERLRRASERQLESLPEAEANRVRAQGSMLPVTVDTLFAELIALPEALACLRALGWDHPTFTDGYIISKPGGSPRLFWHYDWFAWEDARSYETEPPQVFLMWYLSDTTPANGCLRAIPGSHVRHNHLHDLLGEPHSGTLSTVKDGNSPEFSDRPDEVAVPVAAGDLLIGDARLLHAAHANITADRRTLITLWYQPDFADLPERIEAQMVAKAQHAPQDWQEAARAQWEALLPRYMGTAQPYPRSLYRRRD